MDDNIYVTRPALPPLEEFVPYLENIWKSRWLTNEGRYHKEFEQALCDYLGVQHCSLFTNGTLALIVALQALRITGEVITTPYSFVATTHALHWNGIKPVFCDIEEDTFNMDPERIEAAITPQTTAILPVHVYGNPCQMDKIEKIADIYGLKVIYDAAHAFGIKENGRTILDRGDLSIMSFHATKTFTTFEGGAVVTNDEKLKKRIDYLKNFGFAGEITVVAPGINAKMNEFQAALGLLQLKYFTRGVAERKKIASFYREELQDMQGIRFPVKSEDVYYNYSYFPILIVKVKFGCTRDDVYLELRKNHIYTRRYFYPLISTFSPYRGLPSAKEENLKTATKISHQVLCLPIYPGLGFDKMDKIVQVISAIYHE